MTTERIEVYFVATACESPERIYFNALDAFGSTWAYIDSFDMYGERIRGYKNITDEGEESPEAQRWTTEF